MTPLPIKITLEKSCMGTTITGSVNIEFRLVMSPDEGNDTAEERFYVDQVARALLHTLYRDRERAARDACRTLSYTTPTHDSYREAQSKLSEAFTPEYTLCVKRK